MSQKLTQFLHAIERQKPINLSKFESLIRGLKLHHYYQPSDILGYRKKDKYIVESIHPDLWAELSQLASQLGHDRVSSARQNRSHQHAVNGSLLLVRQGVQHPKVVLIDKTGDFQGINSLSEYALIIENRELFLRMTETLKFVQTYCSVNSNIDWYHVDMIFGMGNEISNQLHQAFLSGYQKIYLLLDVDLGGLITAKNLYHLLPSIPQLWLQPYDIEQRLQQVVERCDSAKLNEVIKLGQAYPHLQSVCQMIAKHHKFLEQESYLHAIE